MKYILTSKPILSSVHLWCAELRNLYTIQAGENILAYSIIDNQFWYFRAVGKKRVNVIHNNPFICYNFRIRNFYMYLKSILKSILADCSQSDLSLGKQNLKDILDCRKQVADYLEIFDNSGTDYFCKLFSSCE